MIHDVLLAFLVGAAYRAGPHRGPQRAFLGDPRVPAAYHLRACDVFQAETAEMFASIHASALGLAVDSGAAA